MLVMWTRNGFPSGNTKMKRILFSVFFLVLGIGQSVRAADLVSPSLAEKLEVRYHDESDRQTLDVFAPKEARLNGQRPVVLFVHGGAWMFGDKNFFGLYRNVGRFLASQGMVAVLVNYRLSPMVRHPEHARDVARAFAWVRKNIGEHGGDPDRIILAGHSAGGHIVALLATDPRFLTDSGLKLGETDRAALRGVVAICGVYRIPSGEEFARVADAMASALTASSAPILLAGAKTINPFRLAFGEDPLLRQAASPLNHVRKGLPPFLVLYAESELPLLADMANEFSRALKAQGNQVDFSRIAGSHHNTILFRLSHPGDPTAEALVRFLNQFK